MRTIIIADKQEITAFAVRQLASELPDVDHFIVSESKAHLISVLLQYPDSIVILDYTLFDFISADDLLITQSRFRKTDWLLFSDELNDSFIKMVLFNSQSFSVVFKDSGIDEIRSALKSTIKSIRFICNKATNLLLDNELKKDSKSRNISLTSTEQEILREIALGKTTREIASQRYVSIHTIMTHRKNIFRKIEVNNVHEATRYAMRAGIVDVAEYYI